MAIKPNRLEQGFLIGMGVHYLATRKCGFFNALSFAIKDATRKAQIERERVVDPYNRTVE